MSRLFDALQRSEAERSGLDVEAIATATQVLRLAELHANSERKNGRAVEWLNDAAGPARNDSSSSPAESPSAISSEAGTAVVAPAPNDKLFEQLGQIEPLKVSVTLQSRLVCLADEKSLGAEKFRFLGVRLQHLRRDRPLKKLLITSTIPGEGKSMIAANLACSLARKAQQKTLLVGGDVRRPALSQLFGLREVPGICEWLQGERELAKSIYYLDGPGLWILPSGATSRNPLELLQSGRLPSRMDQLAQWFDWIVIDSPPVLPLADTSIWMRIADGILLVARQGVTQKRQLQKGLEAIEPKKLIGALLNGSKSLSGSNYYYYSTPHP